MYGNNINLPHRILSYESALQKYEAIKPIRGRQDQNSRPLARRSNDNLTIRKDPTNHDIVIRLYRTDIIRYLSKGDGCNNQIMLDPHPSVTTNRVMWSILGPYVNTYWSDRYSAPSHMTEVNGRYYHTPEFALIQPHQDGWYLVAGAKPIEVPYLNRKEGRQALKDSNYYTFKLWLETRVKLGVAEFGHRWGGAFQWTPREAVQYLHQGEKGWAEISRRMSHRVPLETELRSLREAVYKSELCYDTEAVPYFESYGGMTNALRRIKGK